MKNIGTYKNILLLSYICIASISAAIITPALPQIESTYKLNHGALEWVISIFLLGYVVGQLIYAPLANRFGRLTALRAGLFVNLIGIVLCILSSWVLSYNLLLIGRLITGLGAAAGLSCTFILINELLSEERAKYMMSFTIVSFTIGIGLAVSIGGFIAQYSYWQNCFLLLFVHGIVMLCLTYKFTETLKKPILLKPFVILSAYYKALKSGRLIVFSSVVGFVSTVGYCYSAAAPIYAHSILLISPDIYGYWNLINMLGMLGSGFLSAYLIKKYSPLYTLYLGFSCMIPCLISLLFIAASEEVSALWFFMTTMFLYLFSGLLFPSASFFASNAIIDKASASSTMSFINMGTAMIAVIIMGYLPIKTISAFTTVLCVFFIIALILVLIFIDLSALKKQLEQSSAS